MMRLDRDSHSYPDPNCWRQPYDCNAVGGLPELEPELAPEHGPEHEPVQPGVVGVEDDVIGVGAKKAHFEDTDERRHAESVTS